MSSITVNCPCCGAKNRNTDEYCISTWVCAKCGQPFGPGDYQEVASEFESLLGTRLRLRCKFGRYAYLVEPFNVGGVSQLAFVFPILVEPLNMDTGRKIANYIGVSNTNAISKLNLQAGDVIELTATPDHRLESVTPFFAAGADGRPVAKYRLMRPTKVNVVSRAE